MTPSSFSSANRSEAGSLPMVLLAAIILAGVLAALFTTVLTGTNTARFDRDFSQAFQIADAGIQQSFVQLLDIDEAYLDPDDPLYNTTDPCGDGVAAAGSNVESGTCTTELDDGSSFTWSYERIGELRQWEVTSQGTHLGTSRAVRANVGEGPLFSGALMSDDDADWSGGGTAVSGSTCNIEPFPIDVEGVAAIDPTGPCISQLTLWGIDRVITSADKINTYLSGVYPAGHPQEGDPKEVIFTGEPLNMPNIGTHAFQGPTETFPLGGPCHGVTPTTVPATLFRGETYCLSDFVGGVNQTIRVEDNPDPGVPTDARVMVYVQNNVTFRTNSDVNSDKLAVDLQIYAGGTEVTVQGTSNARAAIWAPAASCRSLGGPGSFWGAMACYDIHLSGNWNYDASVQEIQGSTFNISRYSEEPTS